MLNKDKCFKAILKEFTQELNSFENLKVDPHSIYSVIIEPLLSRVCDKYWADEHILYSISLIRLSFDKRTRDIGFEISLHVKEIFEPRFKAYRISITFQNKVN